MLTRWWIVFVIALRAIAQTGGVNMAFESGPMQSVPQGLFVPTAFKATAARIETGCKLNSCAELRPEPGSGGNLMQNIDAAPFRNKKFRFTLWVDWSGGDHSADQPNMP